MVFGCSFGCHLTLVSYAERYTVSFNILRKIGKRCLLKAYVNGYTYGTDAYLHRDDSWITKQYGKNSVSETIIVYLNENWNPDWAGETVIVSEEGEIELSILPKKNKVLVFDSNKLHAARPVSRSCPELRMVLVLKTVDEKCLNKEVVKKSVMFE